MSPSPRWRAVAFALAVVAALTGLASRIAGSGATTAAFAGVESLDLSSGQPFGGGTFDGAVNEGIASVRLKVKPCAEPIFAAPIELKAVASVELADSAYLRRPGYATTNVYHGRVRKTFSHFDRVLARNPLTPYSLDYFIRFYTPADCVVADETYIDWADRILALATKPSQPDRKG
jgi:hypothetical protein